jgi:hypothetical protein
LLCSTAPFELCSSSTRSCNAPATGSDSDIPTDLGSLLQWRAWIRFSFSRLTETLAPRPRAARTKTA